MIRAAAVVTAVLVLLTGPPDIVPARVPIVEDSVGWDCRTDGNRICGPDNSNALPAGCYNDAAALVAPWPCYIVVGPDGTADIYTGA